jgi:ABC-type dipeptide/oligopeptide/nickel transport system permease subunit
MSTASAGIGGLVRLPRKGTNRRGTIALVLSGLALIAPLFAPFDYRDQHRQSLLLPPCVQCPAEAGITPHAHWLGTDEFGRDELSRLLVATRTSTLLCLAMASIAIGLAVVAAMWSALSSVGDGWLRSLAEVTRSLPWIFVLVAVRAALPLDSGKLTLAAALIVLFAAGGWAIPAWAMRGAARALMQREFIEASEVLGASRLHILRHHLWPNLRGIAATYFALLFVAAALAEMSLSLVGLGIPGLPTWGTQLASLKNASLAMHAWWLYAPLAVFVPALVVLNLYAFGRSAAAEAY